MLNETAEDKKELSKMFKEAFGDKARQHEILEAIDSLELSRMFLMEQE